MNDFIYFLIPIGLCVPFVAALLLHLGNIHPFVTLRYLGLFTAWASLAYLFPPIEVTLLIWWVLLSALVMSLFTDVEIAEHLWNFIPDRCEMEGCSGKGRRWQENREDDKFICDYCSVRYYLTKQGLITGERNQ